MFSVILVFEEHLILLFHAWLFDQSIRYSSVKKLVLMFSRRSAPPYREHRPHEASLAGLRGLILLEGFKGAGHVSSRSGAPHLRQH